MYNVILLYWEPYIEITIGHRYRINKNSLVNN